MYRLIIVDDEVAITDWIYQLVSDQYQDRIEVYKAYSGRECLNLMAKGNFDIVMSDIQMPVISGIELLNIIHKTYPRIKKIVLSAYDNFEYAKQAISLEVSSYVLKDESDDMILASVEKALSEVEKELRLLKEAQELKRKSLSLSTIVSNDSLQKVLYGQKTIAETKSSVVSPINLEKPVGMALLSFVASDNVLRQSMLQAVQDSLAANLARNYHFECVTTGAGEIALLVQLNESRAGSPERALELKTLISLYENAQNIFYAVTNSYFNMVYTFSDIRADDISEKYYQMKRVLGGCANYNCSVIFPDMDALSNTAASSQHKNVSKAVETAKKYISENLDRDLSLIMLSEVVYLNASYLSFLFKQQTGINISDFIKNERIGKSKEMLADSRFKIHEISKMIGYNNPSYFTQFFKKEVGLTPQEYRLSTVRS
jgi:two-component system response regulator YesN